MGVPKTKCDVQSIQEFNGTINIEKKKYSRKTCYVT